MNERSLRMSGLARGALITYGVALFSWLFSTRLPQEQGSDETSGLLGIGIGLGLQVILLIVRSIVKRYERAHGMRGELHPQAMFIAEMIADGVTVALFAIATFNAIGRIPSGL